MPDQRRIASDPQPRRDSSARANSRCVSSPLRTTSSRRRRARSTSFLRRQAAASSRLRASCWLTAVSGSRVGEGFSVPSNGREVSRLSAVPRGRADSSADAGAGCGALISRSGSSKRPPIARSSSDILSHGSARCASSAAGAAALVGGGMRAATGVISDCWRVTRLPRRASSNNQSPASTSTAKMSKPISA